jgi:sugar lactone lactonase YvrE
MALEIGEARLVADTEDVLGEVPLWDAAAQALTWVDIMKPGFHRLDAASGTVESWTPPEKFGSYALRRGGGVLISGRGGMALWEPRTGALARISTPEADRPNNILNDGRTDPRGRFIVASMDKTLAGPNGRMWRITPALATTLIQDDDIWLPNSICWSPDGRTFYLGDSKTKLILAYDYDLDSGALSNRRLFADTTGIPGEPDGSSVDAEGYLWNARFDGGALVRFAPDGRVDRVVPTPVSRPSHVTFGGPDLRTLYITTARFRLPPERLAAEPMAGGLIAMDVSVAGLPEPFFG